MTKDYELILEECKAYRKRWGNKDIFKYGEKMLEIEGKEDDKILLCVAEFRLKKAHDALKNIDKLKEILTRC